MCSTDSTQKSAVVSGIPECRAERASAPCSVGRPSAVAGSDPSCAPAAVAPRTPHPGDPHTCLLCGICQAKRSGKPGASWIGHGVRRSSPGPRGIDVAHVGQPAGRKEACGQRRATVPPEARGNGPAGPPGTAAAGIAWPTWAKACNYILKNMFWTRIQAAVLAHVGQPVGRPALCVSAASKGAASGGHAQPYPFYIGHGVRRSSGATGIVAHVGQAAGRCGLPVGVWGRRQEERSPSGGRSPPIGAAARSADRFGFGALADSSALFRSLALPGFEPRPKYHDGRSSAAVRVPDNCDSHQQSFELVFLNWKTH